MGKSKTIKIDPDLKKQVEIFISKKENKYMFANIKSFTDFAIYQLLKLWGVMK